MRTKKGIARENTRVLCGEGELVYTLVRARRKTVSLRVLPDLSLEVRSPMRAKQALIDRFVEEKQGWIEKTRARLSKTPPPTEKETLELIRLAKEKLPARVAFFAEKMGVAPKSIRITRARTRFGSCGAKDTLNFSCFLMRYDEDLVDYVVVHELAHILQKNHSPAFYREIEKILPDRRELEKRLKDR